MIIAQVPQGFTTKINVRLIPGKDIRIMPWDMGCQPRLGATRRDADPLALPGSLVGKLREANAKMLEWLSQDAAHARLFLEQPVSALLKAGVELTRAEQKALTRSHRAVRETAVVPPGVTLNTLTVSADPKRRIGMPRPSSKQPNAPDSDCGCGPRGKE
jgi:hypothetical protein